MIGKFCGISGYPFVINQIISIGFYFGRAIFVLQINPWYYTMLGSQKNVCAGYARCASFTVTS